MKVTVRMTQADIDRTKGIRPFNAAITRAFPGMKMYICHPVYMYIVCPDLSFIRSVIPDDLHAYFCRHPYTDVSPHDFEMDFEPDPHPPLQVISRARGNYY